MTAVRRIEFEELPGELAQALEPRVKRLGYLGEFFQCAAHQPEALLAFMAFTEASKHGLADNLVEVIALTCAGWMGNDYERNQHERLCLALGFDRGWVAQVNALAPEGAHAMTEDERRLQLLVLQVLETRGRGASDAFGQTVERLGDAAAIAALMVVGRYVVHGLVVNSLGLRPPVASIFEREPVA